MNTPALNLPSQPLATHCFQLSNMFNPNSGASGKVSYGVSLVLFLQQRNELNMADLVDHMLHARSCALDPLVFQRTIDVGSSRTAEWPLGT
ncbi:hypothetical protein GOODEAATRI_033841 [Goodea atripinnis]|uniref:Splicing factor RBM39 linker domain-containing protein n=1 Tax=Goodea atripinnis TaxID=208336 RepID=A0ABV0NQN7_9TELE